MSCEQGHCYCILEPATTAGPAHYRCCRCGHRIMASGTSVCTTVSSVSSS